jgi:hypothetical protein
VEETKGQSSIERCRQGVFVVSMRLPATKRRAVEHQIAKQVNQQLMRGNISRATRALDAADVAQITPEGLGKLTELRPDAAPPEVVKSVQFWHPSIARN